MLFFCHLLRLRPVFSAHSSLVTMTKLSIYYKLPITDSVDEFPKRKNILSSNKQGYVFGSAVGAGNVFPPHMES